MQSRRDDKDKVATKHGITISHAANTANAQAAQLSELGLMSGS
jgi:hypothetical protein